MNLPLFWLLDCYASTRIKTAIIKKTLLSRRPKEHGLLIAALLVAVCAFVSFLSWRHPFLYEAIATSKIKLEEGQWWTLASSLFLHSDMGHLLSNSYMLFILSLFVFGTLTRNLRTAFFLLLFVLLAGALISFITLKGYPSQTRLVGISGVVYSLAAFWFINYIFIDRRRSVGARILRVIGTGLVVLFPTTFEATTSYSAHFHGFWLGLILGMAFFLIHRKKIQSFEEVTYEEEISIEPEKQSADPDQSTL